MTPTRDCSSQTVRPRRGWQVPKVTCLLVFAVVGLLVYQALAEQARRSSAVRSYTSTATIHQRNAFPVFDADGKLVTWTLPDSQQPDSLQPDLDKIEEFFTTETNINWAVRKLGVVAKRLDKERVSEHVHRSIESMRQNLRVDATWTDAPGELGISLTFTHRNPVHAARLVNGMAESYKQSCRAAWKPRVYRAYVDAKNAADRTRWECIKADNRLVLFEQRLQHADSAGDRPSATPAEPPSSTTPASTHPEETAPETVPESESPSRETRAESARIDNPAWLDVAKQVEQLRQYRAELLVDRTLVHPAVIQADIQIADLVRQLESAARAIPNPATGASEPVWQERPTQPPKPETPARGADQPAPLPEQPAAVVATDARPQTEVNEKHRQLKAAADRADELHEQAELAERQTWEAYQQEPHIDLVLAKPSPVPPAAGAGLGLILAALAAALAAAAGVGILSAGTVMEPTVDTVAQAEAVVALPIAGTVPLSEPADSGLGSLGRWQPLVRLALIGGGLMLIAASAAVLLRSLGS